jgi:hypothetical protein
MKVLIIVFGLVGIGLLTGGVIAFQDTKQLVDVAVEVPGTVVDLTSSSSDGSTTYSPVYEYEFAGQTYRHETSVSTSSQPSIGETTTLLVDPDDPTEVKPDTFLDKWFLATILGGLGVLFGGLSVVFMVVGVARRGGGDSFAAASSSWDSDEAASDAPAPSTATMAADDGGDDDDAPSTSGPFL